MQRPVGGPLAESISEQVSNDPTASRFTGCFVVEPAAGPEIEASIFSDAQGDIARVAGGSSQLSWFTNNVASSTVPGYLMSGSASTELEALWTTPGAARAGLLEISYELFADAGLSTSFSIGGFGCTNCSSGGVQLIPFDLGVPFAVQASAFQSIESVTTTNGGFGIFGFVSFRARELDGTAVDFQDTPEPGTAAMMLLGAGALLWARRRRNN